MGKTVAENLACRILILERSLEAYRRLHAEELDELERGLTACKQELLVLLAVEEKRQELAQPSEEAFSGSIERQESVGASEETAHFRDTEADEFLES